MNETFAARYDGKVLVPEGPVGLPTGEMLTVRVEVPFVPADLGALPLGRELTPSEVERYGRTFYRERVLPGLKPEEARRYVAVDATTGEYETDVYDFVAVTRLAARCPHARIWLQQFGA